MGLWSRPNTFHISQENAQLEKYTSPTFLPRFRDTSWESSVHSVGEDVAVDNPEPPRRSLRQQLQNRNIKGDTTKRRCTTNREEDVVPVPRFTFIPGMKRESFSTTSRSATPALRMERVRPPGPGPTSHTWASFKQPAWRTILSKIETDGQIRSASRQYFCPESAHNDYQHMQHVNYTPLYSSESWVAKLRLIVCDIAMCVSLCVMNMRCINLTSHLVQGQGSRSNLHCITDNYVKAYALRELQTADSWAHISRGSQVPTLTETIKCSDETPLLH